MNFESVLPALRAGKKIRRKCMKSIGILESDIFSLTCSEILADDWEVVPEKVKKWQWIYWDETNNRFKITTARYSSEESFDCCTKRLQKFLPSEIEVDENEP